MNPHLLLLLPHFFKTFLQVIFLLDLLNDLKGMLNAAKREVSFNVSVESNEDLHVKTYTHTNNNVMRN